MYLLWHGLALPSIVMTKKKKNTCNSNTAPWITVIALLIQRHRLDYNPTSRRKPTVLKLILQWMDIWEQWEATKLSSILITSLSSWNDSALAEASLPSDGSHILIKRIVTWCMMSSTSQISFCNNQWMHIVPLTYSTKRIKLNWKNKKKQNHDLKTIGTSLMVT